MNKYVTIAEYSKIAGFRAKSLLEVYGIPVFISGSVKNGKYQPKYEYEVLKWYADDYLEKYVKPNLEQKLRDLNVEFGKSVILEEDVEIALREKDSNTAIIIYRAVSDIYKKYGLISKKLFASKIAQKEKINFDTAYYRTKVVCKNIKAVAYNNKLAQLYGYRTLMREYKKTWKGI